MSKIIPIPVLKILSTLLNTLELIMTVILGVSPTEILSGYISSGRQVPRSVRLGPSTQTPDETSRSLQKIFGLFNRSGGLNPWVPYPTHG
jgi:hypothetical protein